MTHMHTLELLEVATRFMPFDDARKAAFVKFYDHLRELSENEKADSAATEPAHGIMNEQGEK